MDNKPRKAETNLHCVKCKRIIHIGQNYIILENGLHKHETCPSNREKQPHNII